MKTMYAASFDYGKANLAEVEIEKETAKMFIIANSKNLLGYIWLGKRKHKDSVNMFPDKKSAMLFLLEEARQYAITMQEKADKAKAYAAEFEKAMKGES